MKLGFVSAIVFTFLAVGCGAPAFAENLAGSWNASLPSLQVDHPNAKTTLTEVGETLETGPLTYGGLRWDAVKFTFDQSGHLSKIQLIGHSVDTATVKTQMSSDRSSLWQAVDEVSGDNSTSADVMLCTDEASVTLTYAKPATAIMAPLQIIAFNLTSPPTPSDRFEAIFWGE